MARNKDSLDDLIGFSRSMDRILGSMLLNEPRHGSRMWRPPTDVYETNDQVVIVVEIAGMDPDQIEVSFQDRILRISGRRVDHQPRAVCHCLEIQYGDFVSEVYLPGSYDREAISAEYEQGFLRIILPKSKPGSRTIAIQNGEI